MNKLTLLYGYYIETDTYNYILFHKCKRNVTNPKTKEVVQKEITDTIGYFGKIEHALNRYIDELVKENLKDVTCLELLDVIKELKEIHFNLIKEVLKNE